MKYVRRRRGSQGGNHMKHQKIAAAAAALMLCAGLAGCSKADGTSAPFPESSETQQTTEPAAETAQTTEPAPETTAQPETTAAPDTTAASSAAETAAAPQNGGGVRLLWSERGLEAVAADSEDGYGKPLETGTSYLDWTLGSFSGSAQDLSADFTYDNGTLPVNGILTVLASSDSDNPNGLYLRVDNQADFPYFPQDTRERGWFIIENADTVFSALALDPPPVSASYTVAVTVSVSKLHIHLAEGGYDTVTVTAASRR